ncbi:MAG: winged helix-turn-helix domain-containing protein [Thermoanaerobaculia bacterium]|nr:winged helix-turn-helix domain-containing protein [Thermoanaerobaculia bacterium]
MHSTPVLDLSAAGFDPESGPPAPQLHSFYFGNWTLRGSPRTLEHRGESVPLQPQALQVLEELLIHVGEIVERDDLTARLFADRPFLDHRQAINRAVSQLRRALGDSARTPRFIETVGSRGYRFIAPTSVETIPLARPASNAQEGSRNQPTAGRSKGWITASIAVVALALLWFSTPSRLEPPRQLGLRFADWSTAEAPDSEMAKTLATTLTRELSAEVFLAELPGWSVYPEGSDADRTADRRVEGSLRLEAEDRAVITLHLIDSAGQLQWVRSDSVEISRLDSWLERSAIELVEILDPAEGSPI